MLATVLTQAIWFSVASMMAVLARKRFGAGDWQTLMITAAVPTLMITAVFWNHLLRRIPLRRYLAIHWACTMIPLALAGLSNSFPFLLTFHVLAAIGASGWSPIAGELLRRFYGDQVRGRAFGLINVAMFLGMIVASISLGRRLDADENIFRIYLPGAAVAYGLGILILRRLVRSTGVERQRRTELQVRAPLALRTIFDPITHMRSVLRKDRAFFRYEAAFMTYGLGWMICYALLPVLATDRLKMSYTDFADSTQVICPLFMLLAAYPMGWLMDRIGPARMSSFSFAWLTLYPIGLALADSVTDVGLATAIYGSGMAGVHIGWMLGPVTLAPSRDHVAQYVAIHTTLVGVRGIVAQGLGMLIYRLTGSFTWAFVVAAVCFAWAAIQMKQLRGTLDDQSAQVPSTDTSPAGVQAQRGE